MNKLEIENKIRESLKDILDPELNINIVDLGLVRKIELGDYDENFKVFEEVKVIMTLTSVMCPFADSIIQSVEDNLNSLNIGEGKVELDFSEPWEPSEELKIQLGL